MKLLKLRSIPLIALFILSSLLGGAYCELFYDACVLQRTGTSIGLAASDQGIGTLLRLCLFALVFCIFLVLLTSRFLGRILRWRVPIVVGLVILCTALELSGSSIASIASLTGDPGYQGTLLGIPRAVRSDEWLVFTPLSFSQATTGNPAVSNVVRGTATDMTMVYAQPSWAVATLFRPFLWGFLLLGPSRGLALFWSGRTAALFLVTYQLLSLITNSDKRLSLMGSLVVTFSPAVQWWFAVNGSAELLVFGQGLVLGLDSLLRADRTPLRWALSALICWMMGCYLMVLYPAWQVPLFYVFAFLGIWIAARRLRELTRAQRRALLRELIAPVAVCLAAVISLLALCMWLSRDAIDAIRNTVYPGRRDEAGGGLLAYLPNLATSLAGPIAPDGLKGVQGTLNVCETATYMALFPLGLILAARQAIVRHDGACIALLVTYGLLGFYGIFGLPHPLARLLLLSNVPSYRLPQSLGYLDVMMLLRSMALDAVQGKATRRPTPTGRGMACALVASVCMGLAYACVARLVAPDAMTLPLICIEAVTTTMAALAVLAPDGAFRTCARTPLRQGLILPAALIAVLCGAFVNPVQQGAPSLTDNSLTDLVGGIGPTDADAVWATDSEFLGQVLIANGIPTINSVNTYPQLDRWHRLDPDGTSEDVYNRYAFIRFVAQEATVQPRFELLAPDLFCVHASASDLRELGVTYFVTSSDDDLLAAQDGVRPVRHEGTFTVYQIE